MKSKLPNTTTSIFATMSQLSAQHDALNMSQGFPSFTAAQELKELHQQAIATDHNQYAPMKGLPVLRQRISQLIEQQHGAIYDPEKEICVTVGATQAIFTAIQCAIHPGDEVILLTPAYDCYDPAVTLAGGKIVTVPLELPGFDPDWQRVKEAVTSRTRMIIINSPHNPSGSILSRADMQELENIVVNHDLLVLSDEVYEHMVFDQAEHESAARYEGLRERSFITGSFGKTFHVTGWKLGYCIAPDHMMAQFYKVHQQVVFCVNHPSQVAVAQYIMQSTNYTQVSTFYERKRDLFLSLIKESNFKFTPTRSTYFQLLDYSDITNQADTKFARHLTIEHKIASIPISVFMNGSDPKMLRFCFAKEDHELIQAAKILNSI